MNQLPDLGTPLLSETWQDGGPVRMNRNCRECSTRLPETDTHDNFFALISRGSSFGDFSLVVDLFDFPTCNRARGQKMLVAAELSPGGR